MATLQERIIGALRLEARTYEDVENDQTAMGQAAVVIVAASLAGAIGAAGLRPGLLIFTLVLSLVAWVLWALITFLLGTKVFPEPSTRADLGQLLRVLGFAAAPGLFAIFGFIPILGYLIRFVVWIWQLAAMVIAVRQALDYSSTGRAVLVCVVGWVAYLVVMVIFGAMFGGMAMVGGALRP